MFLSAVSDALDDEKKPSKKTGSSGGSGGAGIIGKVNNAAVDTGKAVDNQFTDLSEVPWAAEALDFLKEKGVVSGVTEDRFEPMGYVTREQFVKMLVEAFGFTDANATTDFDDVASDAWYCQYVASAVNHGLVNGKGDNIFGIGERITRQDMAVMVKRCIEKAGYELTSGELDFDDADMIADYAKDAVSTLQHAKIINGVGNGRFEPLGTANRAQAAVIIYNAMKITGYAEEE